MIIRFAHYVFLARDASCHSLGYSELRIWCTRTSDPSSPANATIWFVRCTSNPITVISQLPWKLCSIRSLKPAKHGSMVMENEPWHTQHMDGLHWQICKDYCVQYHFLLQNLSLLARFNKVIAFQWNVLLHSYSHTALVYTQIHMHSHLDIICTL